MSVVDTTATSITLNWMYDTSDADGYVVYYNGFAKLIEGHDKKEMTLGGLMPETNFSITVRAYQDILGPASTVLYAATESINGKRHQPYQCIYVIIKAPLTMPLYIFAKAGHNGWGSKSGCHGKTISNPYNDLYFFQ